MSRATCQRDADGLIFSGALDRAAAVALWPQASRALSGAQRIVLTNVTTVDSAGLALLAELATRVRDDGQVAQIIGEPSGFAELCAAYRLDATLA